MGTIHLPDTVVLHVWHDGDRSVGLPGDNCTVSLDVSGYDQSDRHEYVEQVRETLRESFSQVWDFRVKVMTDQEVRLETETDPVQRELSGDVQTLLTHALRYIEHPETVDVDWLAASLQRHAAGQSLCDRHDSPAAAVRDADQTLSQVGLPTYTRLIQTVSEAKPYVEASVRGEHARDYPNAYMFNMSRLASVERVLDLHRSVSGNLAFLPMDDETPEFATNAASGFVLAFPGAAEAEGQELVETLRQGGNNVQLVPAEVAAPVLREVCAAADSDDDLRP